MTDTAGTAAFPRCRCGAEWHGLPRAGCPGSPEAGPATDDTAGPATDDTAGPATDDTAGPAGAEPDLWQRLAASRSATDVWCAPDLES